MARQSIGVLQAYGGKWHLRCRPPYEEQNARISILVNGIAERPDTFVQTVLGQLQKPLADGAGHTFSACRRAVRFDVRGIDHLRIRRSSTPGQFPEQVFPDAAPSPTHKAVIDRGWRTVLGRAIAPATTAFSTWTMPLITRRSSARSTPRTSVGRCGSIRFHCSSLSQNRFLRISRSPSIFESGSYSQRARINEF